jgi:hypothetical protein
MRKKDEKNLCLSLLVCAMYTVRTIPHLSGFPGIPSVLPPRSYFLGFAGLVLLCAAGFPGALPPVLQISDSTKFASVPFLQISHV